MTSAGELLWLGAVPSTARVLCLVVHGRGQSPEDMENMVIARLSVPGIAYALPRAAGKSWYAAKAVDALTDKTRDELSASLAALQAALSSARAAAPGRPLVLAGFSQGACLSIEHVCTGLDQPDALVAFTGCRVGVPGDEKPDADLQGLPVYATGSDADSWIPVGAFAQAVADLGRMRARLRADLFPGRAHEVSAPEIAMLNSVLTDLAAGRAPAMEVAR